MVDIFKYPDTNSSRAEIEYLNRKFKNQTIAIIGMGGTGSYILDQIAKTPVKAIHIFDADFFQVHNAFRAPGAIQGEKFDTSGGLKKVSYYYEVYSNMHSNIIPHDEYITESNLSQLAGCDYVFVSVDKNKARYLITHGLLKMGVTFIDTGLGINKSDDNLVGTLRVTVGTSEKNDHLSKRIGSDEFDENEYGKNIQIADLNCLNAILAIIKWKKLSGFYQDAKEEHNQLYFIITNRILNEDYPA